MQICHLVTGELSLEQTFNIYDILSFYAENGIDYTLNETPTNYLLLSKEEDSPKIQPVRDIAPKMGENAKMGENKVIAFAPPPPSDAVSLAKSLVQNTQNLQDLHAALGAFEASPLKKTAKHLIFATGNPQAQVMFIGDTPKGDDDAQGLAYHGAYGELMDNMLKSIGLSRENAYLTHIIPYRPPGNRAATPQELNAFLPFALRHIEIIAPKLLVILGGVATTALLNSSENLVKLRGKWLDLNGIAAMPTFHPDYLLKHPLQKRLAYQDLLAIKAKLTT